jgi:phosphoesterase RecJ-like protein
MTGRDRDLIAGAAAALRPLLETARTAALITHTTPDGDGIGAEICLVRYLKARGIDARVLNTEPLTLRYRFLDPHGEVMVFDDSRDAVFVRDADLIFMLDNAATSRMGTLGPYVRASRATTVCIDHHNLTDPFWNITIVDEEACATGELVFQIVKALGGTLDHLAAQAAYVSLVTDTGGFRFSKTSPRCHEAAAEMLAAGVDPPHVYQEVFERNSPAILRLMGLAFAGLRIEERGRLAWITLTHEQVVACDGEMEDTSDVINELLTVDGVRMAVLLKGLRDDRTKLSFRSKGDLDVNRLAASFGGGGHNNAAGAVIEAPLTEAIAKVLDPCRALLNKTP